MDLEEEIILTNIKFAPFSLRGNSQRAGAKLALPLPVLSSPRGEGDGEPSEERISQRVGAVNKVTRLPLPQNRHHHQVSIQFRASKAYLH